MVTMVGTLCACEKQSTGIVKMTGSKEQTADEKEKVSEQNADQTVENNDIAQLPKNEENSESGSENEAYTKRDKINAVRQNTRKYDWFGSITAKAGKVPGFYFTNYFKYSRGETP